MPSGHTWPLSPTTRVCVIRYPQSKVGERLSIFAGEYVQSEHDIARCSYRLLESSLFTENKDYVRRQIVYSLLQVRRAQSAP